MYRLLLSLIFVSILCLNAEAQIKPNKFGKGIQLMGKDSTYALRIGFRFQSLHVSDWTLNDDSPSYEGNFLVRRSRLKLDGWALSPKLKYKLELGLSNRDLSGGNDDEFRNAPNLVLDAYVAWNFYQNFTIQFGQTKLPGNRERVVSSGNMQFVDRSRLNSRFTLDRDMGLQFKHHFNPFGDFLVKETFALSQGEGRNVTEGHFGGYDYTFKLEFLPFGKFASKGDYVGSAIKYEETPKLAVALSYDINDNAVRERGQKGSFIIDDGVYVGRTLNTFCADFMFKYQNISVMGEYALRDTAGDLGSFVYNGDGDEIGTYYTGNALNLQAGYMLDKNWEVALRYTDVNPDKGVAGAENYYTMGISKYIIGHKLKIQTDLTYLDHETKDDHFTWRAQVDFHF